MVWKQRWRGIAVATATAALLGSSIVGAPTWAQGTKTPARGSVPAEPGATTASYGDWVLRCQTGGTAEKPARLCEVGESMQVQGQNAPIAQIALTRAGSDGFVVVVVLPTNVSFPSRVAILTSEKDTVGEAIDWRRCLPGRCVAEAVLKDATLARWRAASAGRITFVDGSGRRLAIPLSFRGLAQALDALDRQRPGAER